MSTYDDLKQSGQLTETLATLKAYLEVSKDTPAPTPEQYKKLSQKYEDALRLIEILKAKVDEAQTNKLPTKDEVESMSAMLDVLNKLDIKTLDKLSMLGKKDESTND
jgi:hypothetical protein